MQCSPPRDEAAQFGRTRSQKFLHSVARRRKDAWDDRRGSDCSLVARVFRISHNHRVHSRGSGCRGDLAFVAFHESQHGKSVDRS